MLYTLSRSLGLLTYLPRRGNKDRTSLIIRGPDIKGLSVNLNSGGKLKLVNRVKGALVSPRLIVVST